jgi:hypothetical protein
VQGRPFKVADGDVKPAIVLLRQIQNNYWISIALIVSTLCCDPFSFMYTPPHVGAAEGCDLLTLFFEIKSKIKRSQPAAAPTGRSA